MKARASTPSDLDVPEGFSAIAGLGPFLRELGPLYIKRAEGTTVIGLRIEKRHSNSRGIAHGGVLLTLADSAMGGALYHSREPHMPIVTVNLTSDFLSSAREGDWLEAHVEILRVGRQLAYANCDLWTEGRRVLRASGVFAITSPVKPNEISEG